MLFTNIRSKEMTFTKTNVPEIFRKHPQRNPQPIVVTSKTYVQKIEERAQKEESKKKIRWGEPFWNLFHVLAEKVVEEKFMEVRDSLLNLIYTICVNIPCPDCANHAKLYLHGINFKSIQTKLQLKDMLFQFHNSVNARKFVPLFPRAMLDEKYARGQIGPIINHFLMHFNYKHKSIRMISDDFYRARVSQQLLKWFNENIPIYFEQ